MDLENTNDMPMHDSEEETMPLGDEALSDDEDDDLEDSTPDFDPMDDNDDEL